MRRRTTFHGLLLVTIAHLACVPAPHGTDARFGPPAVVLDADTPVRSYLIRLCGTEDAGTDATASLGVYANMTTPGGASVLVEHDDNEPLEITATDPSEAVGTGAIWYDHDIAEACETGVVVTFALLEADGAAEIDWLLWVDAHSFAEEQADHLTLELHVEALD